MPTPRNFSVLGHQAREAKSQVKTELHVHARIKAVEISSLCTATLSTAWVKHLSWINVSNEALEKIKATTGKSVRKGADK